MKKLLLVLVAMFILVLTACGGNNDKGNENADNSTSYNNYPEKPIELIVPYDAGGNSDGIARLLAEKASEFLPNKQRIVIVNKPGGNGAIGTSSLMHVAADGYTVGLIDEAGLNIRPHLDDQVDFTHDSFQTIMQVANVPQLIVTTKDSGIETFAQLLEKDNQKIGTTGAGGIQELIIEQLRNEVSDFSLNVVSYVGSANVVTGGLSQEVPR